MRLELCENSFMMWGTPQEINEFISSKEVRDKKIISLVASKKNQIESTEQEVKIQGEFKEVSDNVKSNSDLRTARER